MSVQRRLERAREILVKVAERPDCAEVTGYNPLAIKIFCDAIEQVLERYRREAARIRKYHH